MVTFKNLGSYGRLGNQMFQIASTVGIAIKNNTDYGFPEWSYAEHFYSKFPRGNPAVYETYKEPDYRYRNVVLDTSKNWNLEGYFQSWRYFDHCKDVVTDLFHFFKQSPIDAVAVHVRRGDYLHRQDVHPVLTMDYYREAMLFFSGERFNVFSDDIEWCVKNFPHKNVYFNAPNKFDVEDLKEMSSHKALITANSSFSWWAAYLSDSSSIVAPKLWVHGEDTNDRVPPDWIRI